MAFFNIGMLKFSGNNVTLKDEKLYIDGTLVEANAAALGVVDGVLEIRIVEGSIENLQSDRDVTAGLVKGSVEANGSVNCDCVGGSVTAGGSVRCGRIGGDATAGSYIRHA